MMFLALMQALNLAGTGIVGRVVRNSLRPPPPPPPPRAAAPQDERDTSPERRYRRVLPPPDGPDGDV